MHIMTNYTATHDETGEVLTGTTKELAWRLGVVPGTVNKAAIQGKKIAGHWAVEKVKQENEIIYDYKFPLELLKEWDAVTKPFKEASRRAGAVKCKK